VLPGLAAVLASVAVAVAPQVRVTIVAPTHTPKANAPWPVTITVADARGKPLAARLTMRILLGGLVVGKVDGGRVYRFAGTWREKKGEEIKWPAAARGRSFAFRAVVTARGRTVKKDYEVRVR
jgi:hypothetical protein